MRTPALLLLLLPAGCYDFAHVGVHVDGGEVDEAVAPTADLAAADLAPPPRDFALLDGPRACGQPGARGNSLGVGKYCLTGADCAGNKEATICQTFVDPLRNVCTKLCAGDGGAGQCGERAVCFCIANLACGCAPLAC